MAYLNGVEQFFGEVLTVIDEYSKGYVVGEVRAVSSPIKLSITDIGNYYLQSDQFLADLQNMWEWDSDEAITWGCFSLVRTGNNTVGVKDTYTDTVNDYLGARISEGGSSPTTVKIVKSDTAILIDMSGGTIIFFSAVDSNNTTRKCVSIATSSNTYEICLAADDGTSANIYKKSNNAFKRVTNSVYELTPFFDELTSGFVKTNEVAQIRSLPNRITGLYSIGNSRYYFGNYSALKDW